MTDELKLLLEACNRLYEVSIRLGIDPPKLVFRSAADYAFVGCILKELTKYTTEGPSQTKLAGIELDAYSPFVNTSTPSQTPTSEA